MSSDQAALALGLLEIPNVKRVEFRQTIGGQVLVVHLDSRDPDARTAVLVLLDNVVAGYGDYWEYDCGLHKGVTVIFTFPEVTDFAVVRLGDEWKIG